MAQQCFRFWVIASRKANVALAALIFRRLTGYLRRFFKLYCWLNSLPSLVFYGSSEQRNGAARQAEGLRDIVSSKAQFSIAKINMQYELVMLVLAALAF